MGKSFWPVRPNFRAFLGITAAAFAYAYACVGNVSAEILWKPVGPVTLVVPYGPGGGNDAIARALSRELALIWGQPVVVENVPGADGLIGTRRVIEAKPNGYTLLLQNPSIAAISFTPGMHGANPLERLVPITAIARTPSVAVVSGKIPVKTMAEFVQYCKRSAKPCSFASSEITTRLMAKQFAAETGLTNTVVANYRGSAAIVSDLVADNVDMTFTGIAASLPHHKAGSLRILATLDDKRAALLPEVPTATEAGFPTLKLGAWFGLFAPSGTPPIVTQGIIAALREALKDGGVQMALTSIGAEPMLNTPAAFAAQVRALSEQLGALVKRYSLD